MHSESRIVPYTADLMYRVVADVESYPQFLPWVVALRVLSRAKEAGRDVLSAEMLVGYSNFREKYTSHIVCDPAARTIAVSQEKGPFRHLENNWRFVPEGDHARVEFSIAFEFKSRLMNAVASRSFEKVMLKMTDAFTDRARDLSQQAGQQP